MDKLEISPLLLTDVAIQIAIAGEKTSTPFKSDSD